MPKYTVVARTRASAVFYPGNALAVPCHTMSDEVSLTFRTTYKAGFDVPLPVDFYVEAVGEAPDMSTAVGQFMTAAIEITNVIAFVTNAHLGQLELELAYDCSPDKNEHEFMQRFVPQPPTITIPGRPIDPDLAARFLDMLDKNFYKERLQRAISQYIEAVRRWNAGHEIMCVAHLYMGVEALTKASLRAELKRLNLDERGLAAAWNIDIDRPESLKLDLNKLDGEVRRRLIFNGDDDCFSAVKKISDGFEHGFAKYSDLHQPARDTVSKAAGYLRAAILRMTAPDGELDSILTSKNWSEVRGPLKPSKIMRGALVGPVEALAKEGDPYPILIWKSSLRTVRFGEDGRYGFTPNEEITPQLGAGVSLRLGQFEFWDDTVMSSSNQPTTPSPLELKVSFPKRRWLSKIRAFAAGFKILVEAFFS